MAESRNPRELLHTWRAWRAVTGRTQRRNYLRFIQLENKVARRNGILAYRFITLVNNDNNNSFIKNES